MAEAHVTCVAIAVLLLAIPAPSSAAECQHAEEITVRTHGGGGRVRPCPGKRSPRINATVLADCVGHLAWRGCEGIVAGERSEWHTCPACSPGERLHVQPLPSREHRGRSSAWGPQGDLHGFSFPAKIRSSRVVGHSRRTACTLVTSTHPPYLVRPSALYLLQRDFGFWGFLGSAPWFLPYTRRTTDSVLRGLGPGLRCT